MPVTTSPAAVRPAVLCVWLGAARVHVLWCGEGDVCLAHARAAAMWIATSGCRLLPSCCMRSLLPTLAGRLPAAHRFPHGHAAPRLQVLFAK